MLIGIEASRANRREKTGVEWYAWHVIQQLKQFAESDAHSWLLYSNEPLMMGLEKGPKNWHEMRLAWPPKYLWTQTRLSWEMYRSPPDVLYVPAHVLPRAIPARSVVTIHDVGFARLPELYKPIQRWYHDWATKDIVKRASRILTVSEFSKREIIEFYGAHPDKIFVTPNGIDHARYRPIAKADATPIVDKYRLPEPYLLFVGRLERKKNVKMIVEAFTRFKQLRGEGDPLHLALAGLTGVGFEEIEAAIAASPAKSQIRLLGYVNEDDKAALLNRATALVHPAWYEGFGIPPLEALACGTQVICSWIASLPEVVGEPHALWFDPRDIDSLVQQITRAVDDPAGALERREAGIAWAKQYTWERTARETLPLLTQW